MPTPDITLNTLLLNLQYRMMLMIPISFLVPFLRTIVFLTKEKE